MRTRFRRKELPARLHGRARPDRLLQVMNTGLSAWMWAEKFTRLPALDEAARSEFFEVEIVRRTVASADGSVVALTMANPDGEQLPEWFPGAHIELRLPSGALRQYSLCGDRFDRSGYRIAVRRIPDGGGSAEVHDHLTPGTRTWISMPRNAFPLAIGGFNQRLDTVRLIAGGIGITPILPMIRGLDRAGAEWSLIYCGRDTESLPFLNELGPYGARVRIHDDASHGRADAARLLGELPHTDAAVYACGPTPMLDAVSAALTAYPDVEYHAERFAPAPVVDGSEFTIRLTTTDELVTVPADRTALDVLLAARPDLTYSCRQGFCRSCVVRIQRGDPDHRSTTLTPNEIAEGLFLPCVSRASGELSLDL